MKHTRKILLNCTNDAGSNYGDSGFIDVKTYAEKQSPGRSLLACLTDLLVRAKKGVLLLSFMFISGQGCH